MLNQDGRKARRIQSHVIGFRLGEMPRRRRVSYTALIGRKNPLSSMSRRA